MDVFSLALVADCLTHLENPMSGHLTLLLAAAVTLGGATVTHAQMQGGPAAHHPGMPAPGAAAPPSMGGAGMMSMMRDMMAADHVEGRIAYQKAELAITDAQLPQWNAVAAVLRLNSKTMQDGMAKMAKDGMPTTAPAKGDMMVTMMSERLEGMKKLGEANKALYAVLTPDQRKTADEMMMGPMGEM